MNSASNPDEYETLLGRLLAGETDLAAPEVQAAMARNQAFAAEARELVGLAGEIGDLEPTEPPMAPELSDAEPWPGADRAMIDLVRRELGPKVAPRHSTRRFWLLAGAAAVPLGLVLWRLRAVSAVPVAPPNLHLGSGELLPNGTTTRDELAKLGFRWGSSDGKPATANSNFTITLFDADGTALGAPVKVTGALQWLPPPEIVKALPELFTWKVQEHFLNRPDKPTWSKITRIEP